MQTQDCFKCKGHGKYHDSFFDHEPGCIFCEKCKICKETGRIPATADRCEKCQGRGKVHDSFFEHEPGCIFCEKCKRCNGKGYIDNPNKFSQQGQINVNFYTQGFPGQTNVNFNAQGFPQQQQQFNQGFPQQQNQGFPQQQQGQFQGNTNFGMSMGFGLPGMSFTVSRNSNSQNQQRAVSMNVGGQGVQMQFSGPMNQQSNQPQFVDPNAKQNNGEGTYHDSIHHRDEKRKARKKARKTPKNVECQKSDNQGGVYDSSIDFSFSFGSDSQNVLTVALVAVVALFLLTK